MQPSPVRYSYDGFHFCPLKRLRRHQITATISIAFQFCWTKRWAFLCQAARWAAFAMRLSTARAGSKSLPAPRFGGSFTSRIVPDLGSIASHQCDDQMLRRFRFDSGDTLAWTG